MTDLDGILQGVPIALTLPQVIGLAIAAVLAIALLAICLEAFRPLITARAARIEAEAAATAWAGGLGDGFDEVELRIALAHAIDRTATFIEGDLPDETRERILRSVLDDLVLGRLSNDVDQLRAFMESQQSSAQVTVDPRGD